MLSLMKHFRNIGHVDIGCLLKVFCKFEYRCNHENQAKKFQRKSNSKEKSMRGFQEKFHKFWKRKEANWRLKTLVFQNTLQQRLPSSVDYGDFLSPLLQNQRDECLPLLWTHQSIFSLNAACKISFFKVWYKKWGN